MICYILLYKQALRARKYQLPAPKNYMIFLKKSFSKKLNGFQERYCVFKSGL